VGGRTNTCRYVPKLIRPFFLDQSYQDMFRPKRPPSGVQVVVSQDSAGQCNAGFLLLLFWLRGLHVAAFL
jgi:hypothetical protein